MKNKLASLVLFVFLVNLVLPTLTVNATIQYDESVDILNENIELDSNRDLELSEENEDEYFSENISNESVKNVQAIAENNLEKV